MKKVLLVPVLVAAVAAGVYAQAGPAGKWTGETQGRQGPQTITLELKVTGGTLAGTFTQGQQPAAEIGSGKVVDAATITFTRSVAGRGGGEPFVITYTGKINGNEMTLTPELPGGAGGGGRGGAGPITLKRAM